MAYEEQPRNGTARRIIVPPALDYVLLNLRLRGRVVFQAIENFEALIFGQRGEQFFQFGEQIMGGSLEATLYASLGGMSRLGR